MKKYIVLFVLLFTPVSMLTVFAQTKVGTTVANFLTIPVGPRASGMGGAFVATANDASALFWNPGGVSRLTKNEFGVSYSQWLVGTNYNWLGLVYKLDENSTFGVSVNQLDYGTEEITNDLLPDGTGENWSAQDIAIGVTYARNLTDRFSIGGTFKYIRQQIWHESASAFALDIGLLFNTQIEGLRLGMNITNFGTEMKLDGKDLYQAIDNDRKFYSGNNEKIPGSLNTDSWTLPLLYYVGVAYDALKNNDFKVTIATDAVYPNNQNLYLNVGGEATYIDMFSLRAGKNSLFKDDAVEGMSYGVGFKYDFGSVITKIDYSYNDYKRFKQISKVSVSVEF